MAGGEWPVNGQEDALPRAVNNATAEYDGDTARSRATLPAHADPLALKLVQSLCGPGIHPTGAVVPKTTSDYTSALVTFSHDRRFRACWK